MTRTHYLIIATFAVLAALTGCTATQRDAAAELILCCYRGVSPETVNLMLQLDRAGWRHSIHSGDALVSRVRSIAVSEWHRWTDGDVFLMVDDDIVFTPEDAERVVALAREKRGIACAYYATRDKKHLAQRLQWGEGVVEYGAGTPPEEITYAATGFMAVHRAVVAAMARDLPFCHPREPWAFWPLFQPFVLEDRVNGPEYLSEDWAFCERARQLGFGVWVDPSITLSHGGVTIADIKGASDAAM